MDPLGTPVSFEGNFSGVDWAIVFMEVGVTAVVAVGVGVTKGIGAFEEAPKLPRQRLLIIVESVGVDDALA